MKLYLIIVDEPFFHPVFVKELITNTHDEIIGITLLPDKPHNISWNTYLREKIMLLGWYPFFILGLKGMYYQIINVLSIFLPIKGNFSVSMVAHQYKIPLFYATDVNHKKHLSYLRIKAPDIILSACGQVFCAELLDIPKYGCINRHSSLLPNYRGILPVFWAMVHNEKEIGVSVNRMVPQLDAGDILAQTPIAVMPTDSLYALYDKAFRVSSSTVIEAIGSLKTNTSKGEKHAVTKGSYFSYPKRDDIVRFKSLGKRIL